MTADREIPRLRTERSGCWHLAVKAEGGEFVAWGRPGRDIGQSPLEAMLRFRDVMTAWGWSEEAALAKLKRKVKGG